MPGVQQIYVPGEVEQASSRRRLDEGVPVEEATWNAIATVASELHVKVPTV